MAAFLPPSYSTGKPLIGAGDPPPFTILNPDGAAKCILICDHAGDATPAQLGLMGLEPDDFTRHYAVDIGVRAVTQHLSTILDAPAILGNYSRLVIDLNRPLDHPTTFAVSGEGKPIPGNIGIHPDDRDRRINEIYRPYHNALEVMVDRLVRVGTIPVILSIHSFTPVFFKQKRPWDVGVMWVQDRRVAEPMAAFFADKGYVVGDNEPYDARQVQGTTVNRHGDARNLPNVLLEIRNDHIRTEKACQEWANSLKEFMDQILADESVQTLFAGPVFQYDPETSRSYFDNLNMKAQQSDES